METLTIHQMEQIEGGGWALCAAGTVGVVAGAVTLMAVSGGAAAVGVWAYSGLVNAACWATAPVY